MDNNYQCKKCGRDRDHRTTIDPNSGYRVTAIFACATCDNGEGERKLREAYRLLVASYLRGEF
jgi:hypothetical protein